MLPWACLGVLAKTWAQLKLTMDEIFPRPETDKIQFSMCISMIGNERVARKKHVLVKWECKGFIVLVNLSTWDRYQFE